MSLYPYSLLLSGTRPPYRPIQNSRGCRSIEISGRASDERDTPAAQVLIERVGGVEHVAHVRVTSIADGTTTVTATSGEASDTVAVTVDALASVSTGSYHACGVTTARALSGRKRPPHNRARCLPYG